MVFHKNSVEQSIDRHFSSTLIIYFCLFVSFFKESNTLKTSHKTTSSVAVASADSPGGEFPTHYHFSMNEIYFPRKAETDNCGSS